MDWISPRAVKPLPALSSAEKAGRLNYSWEMGKTCHSGMIVLIRVFHIGGINFFNHPQKAIDEMIRVAKPGTKIIICDENENGAGWYEKFLPGFKSAFHGQREAVTAPIKLVPASMLEVKLDQYLE